MILLAAPEKKSVIVVFLILEISDSLGDLSADDLLFEDSFVTIVAIIAIGWDLPLSPGFTS